MNIIWVKDDTIDNSRFAIYTFIKIFSHVWCYSFPTLSSHYTTTLRVNSYFLVKLCTMFNIKIDPLFPIYKAAIPRLHIKIRIQV